MRVLAVLAVGADDHEDQTILRSFDVPLPARYTAKPITAGFYAVRQMAEAVSVGLELDDEPIAWGDYAGAVYKRNLIHTASYLLLLMDSRQDSD